MGYRPVGFNSFEICPSVPDSWDFFEIKNMDLCACSTDISVTNGDCYTVKINDEEIILNKGEKYIYVFK